MGAKFGHRQSRKPNKVRSILVKEMLLNNKGGPHKDKRDKRSKRDNQWRSDEEE
jgi:hypothetical protein